MTLGSGIMNDGIYDKKDDDSDADGIFDIK